jgi:hypothetical protein
VAISRIARRIAAKTAARARKIGRHNSVARLHTNLTATADRNNAGTITAGQYLTEFLGADAEFAATYDSPFGKAIKKAYMALHNEEPPKLRLVAVGHRLHRKVGYLLGEPALAAAAQIYPRTAALIGA